MPVTGPAASADYEVAGVDTSALARADRDGAWREEVLRNHGGLELRIGGVDDFAGTTVVQRARDLQLVEFWSDAITYERRARDARRDGDDTVRLLVPRHGRFMVEAADQRFTLTDDTAAMVSMAAPFAITHDAGARAWVFSMPAHVLPRAADPRVPQLLDLTSGAGAVVAAMLGQISHERDTLSTDDFLDTAEALAQLVGRRAHLSPASVPLAKMAADAARRASDDPDLTAATLAARLGWSLRTVQVAAQSAGTTPSHLIRTARLERAAARLRDPAWADRSVSDIALASGFGSISTFNAVFRDAYGTSPSAARRS